MIEEEKLKCYIDKIRQLRDILSTIFFTGFAQCVKLIYGFRLYPQLAVFPIQRKVFSKLLSILYNFGIFLN